MFWKVTLVIILQVRAWAFSRKTLASAYNVPVWQGIHPCILDSYASAFQCSREEGICVTVLHSNSSSCGTKMIWWCINNDLEFFENVAFRGILICWLPHSKEIRVQTTSGWRVANVIDDLMNERIFIQCDGKFLYWKWTLDKSRPLYHELNLRWRQYNLPLINWCHYLTLSARLKRSFSLTSLHTTFRFQAL